MLSFVYPGQGSQAVGMGRDFFEASPVAKETFQEIDDVLHQNLSQLMFEGPLEDLTLTENAQPALMAVSLAIQRVLEKEAGFDFANKVSFVAGHSLGEYSALASAQALSLAETALLLKNRGRAMQEAVPLGRGTMAALLGATLDQAEQICSKAREGQVCEIANDNCPGQVVISGHTEAVTRALAVAAEAGLKRAIKLPVSAPFHCSLMAPAADTMAEKLAASTFKKPVVAVIPNISVTPEQDPEALKNLLVRQITGRVRWRETILALKELGVTKIVEIGAGKVLSGLVKRIDPDLETTAVNSPQDVEAFLKSV